MEIFLAVIVVVCFIAAIIKFASGSASPSQSVNTNLTEEQKEWLRTVGTIFRENKALPFLDVYVECGMPRDIAYSKDGNAIKQAFPFDQDEAQNEGYHVFTSYQLAIDNRYQLQQKELSTIDSSQYGMNLPQEEIIYHRINSVTLHQEKTTRYNIAYSGVKWQSGILRAGSMSVIGSEIARFTPMDIGRLFITNQHILFVGNQKNITKSIPIRSVLYYNLYQDGVLVHIPNKKPILFKFKIGYDTNLSSVDDGLNEFVIILDRIMSGTETQNLPE